MRIAGTNWLGVGLLTVLLVLTTLIVGTPADAAAKVAPVGPLVNTGRWFTDQSGRVVILHGINMVAKRPPYQPSALGFGRDDGRFLARNGFNTVRLGLIYGAVEPEPGRYDRAYIKRSRSTELSLARQGIFTMVDFHQDLYNERFSGEGWPGWATVDDGLPAEPLTGFPATYLTSPGLNRSFDNFWANAPGPGGVGLQDRYAAAWAEVAEAFRRDDAVLGYDLLNEPWPGSDFATCANLEGCTAFDAGELAPMFRRSIEAIRGVDRKHIVFSEPNVLFNFDAGTGLPDLGPNQGFSFHDYCLVGLIPGAPAGCDEAEELVFDNADRQAEETGDSLILSEFGATADVAVLERIARFADEHMVSWQEWHYCGCEDPTTQGPGDVQALVRDPALPPRGDNLFRDKLKALARPYPQVVAGTPERYSFDPESRRFELVYTPRHADGSGRFRRGRTLVFMPRIQYPGGYRARVSGAAVTSRRNARKLVLRAERGARRTTLSVVPRRGVPVADQRGGDIRPRPLAVGARSRG